LFRGKINGTDVCVQVERRYLEYRLFHGGSQVDAWIMTQRAAELHRLMPAKAPPDLSRYLLSPMPGLLTDVKVKVGEEVRAGETLAVIEAMKMENVLYAERDCVVSKVLAQSGDSLTVDQPIIEFQ
jgi:propionyl-CoA carboxylase alpha chain